MWFNTNNVKICHKHSGLTWILNILTIVITTNKIRPVCEHRCMRPMVYISNILPSLYYVYVIYSAGSVVVEFHSQFLELYMASDLERYVKEALGVTDKNFQFGPFAIDGTTTQIQGL